MKIKLVFLIVGSNIGVIMYCMIESRRGFNISASLKVWRTEVKMRKTREGGEFNGILATNWPLIRNIIAFSKVARIYS